MAKCFHPLTSLPSPDGKAPSLEAVATKPAQALFHGRLVRFALLLTVVAFAAAAEDDEFQWPPISPEEWAIKDCPGLPGCLAIILFHDVGTNDAAGVSEEYYRIKVLAEEGKKYGDITIPFMAGLLEVKDIEARTVDPNGEVTGFNGQVYEKVVVKAKGVKFLAKTFTLPDVRVGSVIEYRYKTRWQSFSRGNMGYWLYQFLKGVGSQRAMQWIIQDELYVWHARFSFRPRATGQLMWTWFGLPAGVRPQDREGVIQLEMENIPPFEDEEHAPPESVLKSRVDFFYVYSEPKDFDTKSADWFWKQQGKKWHEIVEDFIGDHRQIKREVAQLIDLDDSSETKLRKLYSRAQQIRNLSFEPEKTEKEKKREKLKDNKNVGDVVKRGYGYGFEINRLFAALARAAGFDAFIVNVAPRNTRFFNPNLLDWGQLAFNMVEVRVDGEPRYFDPGTLYCPFGLIPWEGTGTGGMRIEKGGGVSVMTPGPRSADAVIKREATLQLGEDGSLQGDVSVTYGGFEALGRRLDYRDKDEAGRRKDIEEEIKGCLPPTATVKLANEPAWEQSEETLIAEFETTIPGYGAVTGTRVLLQPAVFQAREEYPFQKTKRIHPVYFSYPFQQIDEVTIHLPAGFQVESLAQPRAKEFPFCRYTISQQDQGRSLRVRRRLVMDAYYIKLEAYSALRVFYDNVRAGDEQQVVLKAVESAKAN